MKIDPVNAADSPDDPRRSCLFTIGHSNHELSTFLGLLRQAGVSMVADVRSQPFSRLAWFCRPDIDNVLRGVGVVYGFLGDALGGRPRQPSLYEPDGRVSYERIRATPKFQQGLALLIDTLHQSTVALLCSEEDPLDCHRALLIGPALSEYGVSPVHLRGDGSAETNVEFEDRLLAATGVGAGMLDGLFACAVTAEERREFLAEAYRLQAARKAYRLRPGKSDVFEGWDDCHEAQEQHVDNG